MELKDEIINEILAIIKEDLTYFKSYKEIKGRLIRAKTYHILLKTVKKLKEQKVNV